MGRLVTVLLVLLAALAGVVVSDRPMPRADLTISNGSDVNTLDPQRMSWMQDLRVARLLFEPLVRNDVLSPDSGIVPAVAERWEISEDGRTYTFHLREGARWSNGSAVTADDFRFSWRRAMLPDLASDYFKLFLFVRGAREFYDWRAAALEDFGAGRSACADAQAMWAATEAKFDELVGMTAADERTLVIELTKPVPYFLDLCAFEVFAPVYGPLVERFEQPDAATGRLIRRPGWTKAGVLIGNGPYRLERWRFKRDMRLEQNEHYWNRANLSLRSIAIPAIADPSAQVMAFQTGAVDFVAEVGPAYRGDMMAAKRAFHEEHRGAIDAMIAQAAAQGEVLDQFEIDRRLPDDPRNHVHAISSFGTYFYNFNCRERLPDGRPNPFADARVRRAFAMCVDKHAIVEQVRRVGDVPARTLIPPGSIGGYANPAGLESIGEAADEAGRRAIAARARELLAQAGYADPARDFPVTVELLFNKDSGHDLIAQVIAKNWETHLGVKTRLMQKEIKVFREDLKKKNYMTGRAGWYGDYGDPTTFLDVNITGNGNNDRDFSNATYDGLLRRAEDEPDAAARLALLSEAERIIMEDELPLIPIFHYATLYMFNARELTGVSTHPRTLQMFARYDVLGDGIGPDVPAWSRHVPAAIEIGSGLDAQPEVGP